MAQNKIKTVTAFDPATPEKLVFSWSDGIESVFNLADLPESIMAYAAFDRMKAKIEDKHSGIANVAEARAASEAEFNRLSEAESSDDWNESGSGRTPILVTAIVECFGASLAEAREVYGKLTDAERRNAEGEEPIKSVIDRIREERRARLGKRAKSVDIAAMLGQKAE